MDFSVLVSRSKAILSTPKTAWPVVAAAPETIKGLYLNYLLVLAAIPAVAHFLSVSIIGVSVPILGSYRVGWFHGLFGSLFTYALTLTGIYLFALIVNLLAPHFGGTKSWIQALRSAAYPYTATALATVVGVIPGLGVLAMLAGAVYSIYLLRLGLPFTMKCSQERAGRYTTVVVMVSLLVGLISAPVVALSLRLSHTLVSVIYSGSFDPDSIGAQVDRWAKTLDKAQAPEPGPSSQENAGNKIEQWAKNLDTATKQMEAAKSSGDAQAQVDALGRVLGAFLGGDGKVESLSPERLKTFIPDALAGRKRTALEAERNAAMGMQISRAHAQYAEAGQPLELEISDSGTLKGLVGFAQGWAGFEQERVTDHGYEKTYKQQGRLTHEKWDNASHRGEYGTVVGERFAVKVSGEAASIDELKQALTSLDLAGLEALKNEGVHKK